MNIFVSKRVHTGLTNRRAATGGDLTDFTVQPAGSQQGGVQSVRSVRGHDHLDSVQCVEAVHLVQQLTGHMRGTLKHY